jgi:hypothetical protein
VTSDLVRLPSKEARMRVVKGGRELGDMVARIRTGTSSKSGIEEDDMK